MAKQNHIGSYNTFLAVISDNFTRIGNFVSRWMRNRWVTLPFFNFRVISKVILICFQKISSAFKPSRLWGPEEPLARYVWMSQRYHNEVLSTDNETTPEPKNYPTIYNIDINKKYANDWNTEPYQKAMDYNYSNNDFFNTENTVDSEDVFPKHTIPRGEKKDLEEKFRSPNICIARGQLGGPLSCNCNRHFTLNVPTLKSNETTTSL